MKSWRAKLGRKTKLYIRKCVTTGCEGAVLKAPRDEGPIDYCRKCKREIDARIALVMRSPPKRRVVAGRRRRET